MRTWVWHWRLRCGHDGGARVPEDQRLQLDDDYDCPLCGATTVSMVWGRGA